MGPGKDKLVSMVICELGNSIDDGYPVAKLLQSVYGMYKSSRKLDKETNTSFSTSE